MRHAQEQYDIRCEWGLAGLIALAAGSDAVVVVDVLSFTTCVEIACSRGASVYPCRWSESMAEEFARREQAILAGPRSADGYSLSPSSLLSIPQGTRLMLPSLNGAALSLEAGDTPTIAACLRNAKAVAEYAAGLGSRIAVVPAGEQWPAGGLRPAFEDLLGAGAVIQHIEGSRSPEAAAAEAIFRRFREEIPVALRACSSGRELIEREFPGDVELAADLDCGATIPVLRDRRAFVAAGA